MTKSKTPQTIAAHSGRMSREHFGTVNTPVYRTSTILMPDYATLENDSAPYTYGRRGTPTSKSLEEAINALEGGSETVLVPSGLAAITTALLTVCGSGDHVLVTDSCYGPTRAFCDRMLKRYGVETTYYDPLIGARIADLIRPNTRAIFCEAPGSLTFEMQDIPAIAEAAHKAGAAVLMDNTWATPVHFRPLAHGVDLSIQAVTKYIGGHADMMMGYVCANDRFAARLRHTHGDLGLFSSADDCFLALRGLRTLPTRLPRHFETALKLVHWLQARAEVERILFPPLESDPGHAIWKRDFTGGCGLFGVVLKTVPQKALAAMMDGFELLGLGWSWGGFESLIVPAHIHRTAKAFQTGGPVIRIHAGLEDADDLIADLAAGFDRMAKTT
jgi:cystathionine beta-lyase